MENIQNPDAIAAQAASQFDRGEYAEALQGFLEAIEIDDTDCEYWVDLADSYLNLERYREVVEAADKALLLHRRHARALYLAARSEIILGQYRIAAKRLVRILELAKSRTGRWEDESFIPNHTQLSDFHNRLGICYSEISEFHSALSHFEMACKIDPEDLEARNNRAIVLAKLGSSTECDREMSRIDGLQEDAYAHSDIRPSDLILQKLDSIESIADCLLAMSSFEKGEYVEALGLSSALLKQNSHHPIVLFVVGASEFRLQRLGPALEHLRLAAALEPDNTRTQIYYADALFCFGSGSERGRLWVQAATALSTLKGNERAAPSTVASRELALEVRLKLANDEPVSESVFANVSAREPEDAAEDALIALKFHRPELAVAALAGFDINNHHRGEIKSEALLLMGQFGAAASTIRPFANRTEASRSTLVLLAKAELELAHTVEALTAAKRAHGLQPNDHTVVETLARCLTATGDHASALAVLRRFSTECGNVASILRLQAEHERLAGQEASAIKTLERLLELEPSNQAVLTGLGQLYLKAGKVGQAVTILERAEKRSVMSVDVLLLKMAAYHVCRRFRDAIRVSKAVLRKQPRSTVAILGGAAAHSALGRAQHAVRLLEQGLKVNSGAVDIAEELAASYLRNAQYQKCIAVFNVLDKDGGLGARGLSILGEAFFQMGQQSSAQRMFQRCLDEDANHIAGLRGMIKVSAQNGRWDDARVSYKRLTRLSGADAHAMVEEYPELA